MSLLLSINISCILACVKIGVYSKLAEKEYNEAIEEMKHADTVIERILFLEGLPKMQYLGSLKIGDDVDKMLQGDLELEIEALKDLRSGVVHCEQAKDFASRDLLASILSNEEEHVDWLETQLDLIAKTGKENYIQSQI